MMAYCGVQGEYNLKSQRQAVVNVSFTFRPLLPAGKDLVAFEY